MPKKKINYDDLKLKALGVLTQHIGAARAIDMGSLYEAVTGERWSNKINDTRLIRKVVTMLREEGIPVASRTDRAGGGYYLAAAGSELEDYCMRLRRRALKSLVREARLRKITLSQLLGQLTVEDLLDAKGKKGTGRAGESGKSTA